VRFVMLGSGAVGGTVGGHLHLTGEQVLFVDKNREHVEAIRTRGLIFHETAGVHTVAAPAVAGVADVEFGPDDVVMLCVKTFDAEATLGQLRAAAPRDIPLFCCQNGVRNEEIAARHFTDVNGLMLLHSCTFLTPGRVYLTVPHLVVVGSYPSGIREAAVRVRDALAKTPLEVSLTDSLMSSKWNKLIVNLNNATFGVIGLSVHEGQRDPDVRHWMADVMEEGLNVLQAAGIRYDPAPKQPFPEDVISNLRKEDFTPLPMPSSRDMLLRPSMWQDLYLRRGVVEAEQFNGEIVKLGKELNVATPLNGVLLEASLEMARSRELPGKYGVAELRRMAERAGAHRTR